MMFKTVLKIAKLLNINSRKFQMNAKVAPNQLGRLMMRNSVRLKTFNITLQYCTHWHCRLNPEVYFNSRITCELTIWSLRNVGECAQFICVKSANTPHEVTVNWQLSCSLLVAIFSKNTVSTVPFVIICLSACGHHNNTFLFTIYLQRNLRRGKCACQLFNAGNLTTGSPLISLSLRPRFLACVGRWALNLSEILCENDWEEEIK